MRTLALLAAAAAALTLTSLPAEAKRRGFKSVPSVGSRAAPAPQPAMAPSRGTSLIVIPMGGRAAAAAPVAGAAAGVATGAALGATAAVAGSAADTTGTVAAGAEPAKASSWCPSERVIGGGKGFCVVN